MVAQQSTWLTRYCMDILNTKEPIAVPKNAAAAIPIQTALDRCRLQLDFRLTFVECFLW